MKTNLIPTLIVVLFSLFIFSGCRKESLNAPVPEKVAAASRSASSKGNDCQLVHLDWGNGTFWNFHYNERGLADEWIINNADGFPHDYTMEYDKNNKLIVAKDHFNNTIYTNVFTYTGRQVTEVKWTNNITSQAGDVIYTYNKKGEMIRQDDIINDVHTTFVYGPFGCTHWDLDFGDYHYLSNDITFEIPNRNPFLSISGIDFGFPFSNVALWDKRWEASDHLVFYDNDENPFVIFDTDPAQTVMQTGHRNYLNSVTSYDRISATSSTYTFTYQNCNENSGGEANELLKGKDAATKTNKNNRQQMFIFPSSINQIKAQIKQFRTDSKNKLK